LGLICLEALGFAVDFRVGTFVGCFSWTGFLDGNIAGFAVGFFVGTFVGGLVSTKAGGAVGFLEGNIVGFAVGFCVGTFVGSLVGTNVGGAVGFTVGLMDGVDGLTVDITVGTRHSLFFSLFKNMRPLYCEEIVAPAQPLAKHNW
jgi:hypothetical protein